MSQYVTMQVKCTNKSAAIAALEKLGYTVEVHDAPIALNNYMGVPQPGEQAHIHVGRRGIGMCCADFGIDLRDGTVRLCDFSQKTKLGCFLQEYATQVAIQSYEDQGRYVVRQDDPQTGEVHLFVQGS